MIRESDTVEIEIEDLNHLGQGVGKLNGMAIFVKGAVPGDKVRAIICQIKKKYCIGEIIEILQESEYRVRPLCEFYERCGACQLQELRYDKQLEFKENLVKNTLKKAGVNMEGVGVYPILAMKNPFGYRNKTAFAVGEDDCLEQERGTDSKKILKIGTVKQGSNEIIDLDTCLLQDKRVDNALKNVKSVLDKYKIKPYNSRENSGDLRHLVFRINKIGQIMLVIVTHGKRFENAKEICNEIIEKDDSIVTIVQNVNLLNDSTILGNENIVLYGDGIITDEIGDFKFILSAHTFFQVNTHQTKVLYEKAIEFVDLNKEDICYDLYCGIGTISLMAAKKSKKVYGIEIVEKSIEDAKLNAMNNSISNVEFYVGKVEKILLKLYKKEIKASTIILDPPRKGCEKEALDAIVSIQPQKIVYVSCNPATLARDIVFLQNKGYCLQKVQPVEMFANTTHVETVCLLCK